MARIFHRNLFSFLTHTSTNANNNTITTFRPCPNNFQDCYTFPESDQYPSLPPPLPPVSVVVSPDTATTQGVVHISPLVIIIVIVLASLLLLISYYAIVIKYCTFRNRISGGPANGGPPEPDNDQGDINATNQLIHDNVDRDPVIDHPIWLISTVGLHQSVINSITMSRYKKGDGLIEDTDCSVCLSEFQEDETLRILPKCKHAFHVDCIDTWLRSHINCPLCRAGIVANSGRQSLASNDPSFGHSRRGEIIPILDSDSSDVELGNSQRENSSSNNVDQNDQIKIEVDFNAIIRRSFSMDFFRSSNFRSMGGGNHVRNNSSNSSSARVMDSSSSSLGQTLGPPPIKRSYSWGERVFWSSRNQSNGDRDISP